MRLDAAKPTPRQICACFPRMLLGLDYLNPRAADNYQPRRACCKNWITYRNKQRAKPPKDEEKPDFEKLPPLDANNKEARWRQWLAEPNALTNLKLEEGELWIAVGFLQLQGNGERAQVQGRPPPSYTKRGIVPCKPCRTDALKPGAKVNNKKSQRDAQRCRAFVLLPDANHSGGGNFPTGQYRKEGKGPVLFTWSGRCCKKACADAVAKALYQHEHENVPYPEGFTPPPSS